MCDPNHPLTPLTPSPTTHSTAQEHCSELFPASSDRERVRSSVTEMADTSARFRSLALASIDELLSGLAPRLRPYLDVAAAASYTLTEAEYGENEADDPWVHRLLGAVDAALSWARPLLTTSNYDALARPALRCLALPCAVRVPLSPLLL